MNVRMRVGPRNINAGYNFITFPLLQHFSPFALDEDLPQLVGEINSGIVGGECPYSIKAFTFIVMKTLKWN